MGVVVSFEAAANGTRERPRDLAASGEAARSQHQDEHHDRAEADRLESWPGRMSSGPMLVPLSMRRIPSATIEMKALPTTAPARLVRPPTTSIAITRNVIVK
jgi:hypothetical protein